MVINVRHPSDANSRVRSVGDANVRLPRRANDPVVLDLAESESGHQPADLGECVAVFVGQADSYHDRRLPVAGRYERHGDSLSFTPAFGFVPGQDYVVRSRRNCQSHLFTEFRIPRHRPAVPALVTDVYPSSDVLPENVLRFYVHFSMPMTPHRAFDYVTLRDASGVADRAAFMKFKQELWNADRTRLTVLIDPGRIKRGVATNLALGPALLEGNRYELTIDEGWPSADRCSTLPSFSKSFLVAGALRTRPDVERWIWRTPQPGTRETLDIIFDRPFDRHRLDTALDVVGSDGTAIDGTSLIGESERSWSFTPNQPWSAGDWRISVDDTLEDVAGNNFRELLDREVPSGSNDRAAALAEHF
jgi:hypothetical protein